VPDLVASVWDEDQVLCASPDPTKAVGLWAAAARHLIGESSVATVSVDVDDADSELKLRVAGYMPAEVDPPEGGEVIDSVTLEREGPLADLLAPVLRLPPDAPLGALAVTDSCGVDLDFGAGLDVWGTGALPALRAAAAELGITLREQPPED
jgi:hypothetical protein